MIKFKVGDRIKGINAHLGRVGTIVELAGASPYIGVKWDNAKRKSWVSHTNLELGDNSPLAQLSRDDLVRIIAEMYDTVADWDDGWGLPHDTANILNVVGSMCVTYCLDNDLMGLAGIEIQSND